MGTITLIGEKQAKLGHKFLFQEPLVDCLQCKLKQVCSDNLKPGRLYEIVKILPKKHQCNIFEDDMVVVEVKYSSINALIESRHAFEGAIITFKPVEPEDILIKYQDYIHPKGVKIGDKLKIIKILEEVKDRKKTFKIAQLELVIADSLV
jgi:uncharacterized protein (UPF0179 family)